MFFLGGSGVEVGDISHESEKGPFRDSVEESERIIRSLRIHISTGSVGEPNTQRFKSRKLINPDEVFYLNKSCRNYFREFGLWLDLGNSML